MSEQNEHYILATGSGEVERLRLLQEIYGPGTESLFDRVGLRAEMRFAEIGCGSGNNACWIAGRVGQGGGVVAIDNSPEQIDVARKQAASRGLSNVQFQVGDAYAPGLPEASFDVVYCRLVLMHLTDPVRALQNMARLVRPGGKVICEEMDLGCWVCNPQSPLVSKFYEWNVALGDRRGEHFRLGSSLHTLFREAGLATPDVSTNFVAAVRGEQKRVLGLTFKEFAPELIREGLATQNEVDAVAAELMRLAADDTTLFVFPLIMQASATVD